MKILDFKDEKFWTRRKVSFSLNIRNGLTKKSYRFFIRVGKKEYEIRFDFQFSAVYRADLFHSVSQREKSFFTRFEGVGKKKFERAVHQEPFFISKDTRMNIYRYTSYLHFFFSRVYMGRKKSFSK